MYFQFISTSARTRQMTRFVSVQRLMPLIFLQLNLEVFSWLNLQAALAM